MAFTDLPPPNPDERELLLSFLGFLRAAVLRKVEGLDDEQARWTPERGLLPLIGVVNHLTQVERRWVDGGYLGGDLSRDESEFRPPRELTLAAATEAYRERARRTDETVRSLPADAVNRRGEGLDVRWVLVHLVQETARHAGHADATRELLDGTTGE